MPGLCPYFLRFLKDLSGARAGRNLAPGAESGWQVGVAGGRPRQNSLQLLLPPATQKALREGLVIKQPLIKGTSCLFVCLFNFIVSGM